MAGDELTDEEIRREFLWMWDPFHSLPRAAFLVLFAAGIAAHGVLFDPEDPLYIAGPPALLLGLGGLSAWCRIVARDDPPDRMRARCARHAAWNARVLPAMWALAGVVLAMTGAVAWIEWTLWERGHTEAPFRARVLLMPFLSLCVLGVALWYQVAAVPRSRRFLSSLGGGAAPGPSATP